jgi:2,4-diketo-3-deoxy-L-fuconate hydrolase
MKVCIFDSSRIGVVLDDFVVDVTDAFSGIDGPRWPFPKYDWVVQHFPEVRKTIEEILSAGKRTPLGKVTLHSPVANPGKIIGAPINYRDHIAEANADPEINHGKTYDQLDRFGLFLKANSSLIGPSDSVAIVDPDRRIDHEVELAVVIGKKGYRIPEARALEHVFGYCVALDMSVRGSEFPSFRKSPDTFSVLGPWIVTRDEIEFPNALDLELKVNNETRQKSNTQHLIFGVERLIAYASTMYTLFPGDVIMTGTPAGVGPVTPGDLISASVQSIGTMSVRVTQSGG